MVQKSKNKIKEIMRSHKEKTKEMELPIFLGYDENNMPLIVDLVKVGNILVGGASGQGKTNLLHAFAQSCWYALPKVSQSCIVYYIDSKSIEEFSPYFDIQLNTIEDVRKELESICDKIAKRETDKKMAQYPIAVLIDDFDHLVLTDKRLLEKIEYIAMQGPQVGIYTVLTTARMECKAVSVRLRADTACRIAFRTASTYESRSIIYCPDAAQLTNNGEILFYLNGKLTRLQTIKVTTK